MNLSRVFQNAVKAISIFTPVAVGVGLAAIGEGVSSLILPTIFGLASIGGAHLWKIKGKRELFTDFVTKEHVRKIAKKTGLPFTPKIYESVGDQEAGYGLFSVHMPELLSKTKERRDFIIAHEFQHIVNGDSFKEHAGYFSYGFAAAAAAIFISPVFENSFFNNLTELSLIASGVGVCLGVKRYHDIIDDETSHAREFDCDLNAARTLNNIQGGVKLFKSILNGDIPPERLNLENSHPEPCDRIKALETAFALN